MKTRPHGGSTFDVAVLDVGAPGHGSVRVLDPHARPLADTAHLRQGPRGLDRFFTGSRSRANVSWPTMNA